MPPMLQPTPGALKAAREIWPGSANKADAGDPEHVEDLRSLAVMIDGHTGTREMLSTIEELLERCRNAGGDGGVAKLQAALTRGREVLSKYQ